MYHNLRIAKRMENCGLGFLISYALVSWMIFLEVLSNQDVLEDSFWLGGYHFNEDHLLFDKFENFRLGVLLVSLSLTKDCLHEIKNQSRILKRKREEIRQMEEILRRINENIVDFEANADAA